VDNEKVILSQELKTLQNEHQTHKDELEQLQRRSKAVKQKAVFAAQGLQQLSEEKGLLLNELGETKEKLLALQVKLDRLNGQHEELSEKYFSMLTKSDGEKSKLIDVKNIKTSCTA